MKSKNLKKAFSLVELIVALLILGVAVIPLIGTITSDTKNAVVIANNEFAMQKARYILDTMLDSVNFDDLNSGDPAKITGDSLQYYDSMFPESANTGICQGYITDSKGQRFFVYLRVEDIPDNKLNYKFYNTPQNIPNYTKTIGDKKYTAWELAEMTEYDEIYKVAKNPSFAEINFYDSDEWKNTTERTMMTDNFYKNQNLKTLMKTLILNIKWNDNDKKNPENDGFREFSLVTHKARLIK